jgi:hypothetical protein
VLSICSSDSYEATAISSGNVADGLVTIDWSLPTAMGGLPNGTPIPGIVSGLSQTYAAVAELDGCYSEVGTESVSISASGTVSLSSASALNGLCESDDSQNNPVFEAVADNVDLSGGYTWVWLDEDGIPTEFNTNSSTFNKIPTIGRDYVEVYVKVKNNLGCGGANISSDPVIVPVVKTPIVEIAELVADGEFDKYVCKEDAPYALNARDQNGLAYSGNNTVVKWYNGVGEEVGNGSSYLAYLSDEYKVVVTNRNASGTVVCSTEGNLVARKEDYKVNVTVQDLSIVPRSTASDVEEGDVVVLTGIAEGLLINSKWFCTLR